MYFISILRTNFALVLLFKILNWKLFSSDLKPSGMFVTVTDDPEFIIRKLVYSKEHTSQVYSFVEISEKLSSLK